MSNQDELHQKITNLKGENKDELKLENCRCFSFYYILSEDMVVVQYTALRFKLRLLLQELSTHRNQVRRESNFFKKVILTINVMINKD